MSAGAVFIVAKVLFWAMAAVVAFRCFRVILHMNMRQRTAHYLKWLLFGLSYGVLMVAALGAAWHISTNQGTGGDALFLIASAGLIIFDRRRRDARPGVKTG